MINPLRFSGMVVPKPQCPDNLTRDTSKWNRRYFELGRALSALGKDNVVEKIHPNLPWRIINHPGIKVYMRQPNGNIHEGYFRRAELFGVKADDYYTSIEHSPLTSYPAQLETVSYSLSGDIIKMPFKIADLLNSSKPFKEG